MNTIKENKVAFVYMNNERNVGRGAGYVAASVVRVGWNLYFFDTLYTPIREIADIIKKEEFGVLMISTMTMMFYEALSLIRLVKENRFVPTIVGGIHPTIIGSKLLEDYPEIDYLCVGEGETMVVEFLENLGNEKIYETPNLVYRRDGKVIANSIRQAEDLSKIPDFPWHFFPKRAIVQNNGFLYVDASRGCPYNCDYCSNFINLNLYGKEYLRFKPIEHIIKELLWLKREYNPKLFYFGDEMIASKTNYAISLFQAIREQVDMPYGCMVRAEYAKPEIIQIMKETGCQYIGMGVECGDEEFRKKYLNRSMANEQIAKTFSLVKKAGIFVTSFNMIGYPFDNDDLLTQATVDLNEQIRPDHVQITIFYPFPKTKLYDHCVKNNLIDMEKLKNTASYYGESVLKGVLVGEKRRELDQYFNKRDPEFTNTSLKWRYFYKLIYKSGLLARESLLRLLRTG